VRRLKTFIVAAVLALAAVPFAAAPAGAVVCHENPGSCCGEVKVLGKTILRIDC
jgi:hypothetical protein